MLVKLLFSTHSSEFTEQPLAVLPKSFLLSVLSNTYEGVACRSCLQICKLLASSCRSATLSELNLVICFFFPIFPNRCFCTIPQRLLTSLMVVSLLMVWLLMSLTMVFVTSFSREKERLANIFFPITCLWQFNLSKEELNKN